MNAIDNSFAPFMGWCVQRDGVKAGCACEDLAQQFQIASVIDAGEINMKKKAVIQFSCFAFFRIGRIHEPLHSFEGGAFQPLIRIAVQLFQHFQNELVMGWPA